jgi:hypothetical protein
VGNQSLLGSFFEILGNDICPVPKHRDPVNNMLQFFQPVGYVYNSAAFALEISDYLEQLFNFGRRKG